MFGLVTLGTLLHIGVKLSFENHFENVEGIDIVLRVAEVDVELLARTLFVVKNVGEWILVVNPPLLWRTENFECN